jgi:hypothetical protein
MTMVGVALVVLPAAATRAASCSPGLTLRLSPAELHATGYHACQHAMRVQHGWHPIT